MNIKDKRIMQRKQKSGPGCEKVEALGWGAGGQAASRAQQGWHLGSEEDWFLSGERVGHPCLKEVCGVDGRKTGRLHLAASIFSVQWDAQSSAEEEEEEWVSRTEET